MIKTLLLALVIQLVPKVTHTPTVKYVQDGVYVVTNPLDFPADLIVDCGFNYEKVLIKMDANSKQRISFKDPEDAKNSYNVCFMESYSKAKEKE